VFVRILIFQNDERAYLFFRKAVNRSGKRFKEVIKFVDFSVFSPLNAQLGEGKSELRLENDKDGKHGDVDDAEHEFFEHGKVEPSCKEENEDEGKKSNDYVHGARAPEKLKQVVEHHPDDDDFNDWNQEMRSGHLTASSLSSTVRMSLCSATSWTRI
jgi:hypothetical protein